MLKTEVIFTHFKEDENLDKVIGSENKAGGKVTFVFGHQTDQHFQDLVFVKTIIILITINNI